MTTTAHIQTALAAMTDGNFAETATDLLTTLGYRRQRTALWSGAPRDFIERFRATNPGTQSEEALLTNARLLHILFQLTDAEIQKANASLSADNSHLNTGNARSFLFVAVELSDTTYPRGRYAAFTREITNAGRYLPSFFSKPPTVGSPWLSCIDASISETRSGMY